MWEYMISVVIPVYNEEGQIYDTVKKIHEILTDYSIGYKLILVDDGSRDSTWESIKRTSAEYPEVRAVRLSRNFGKEFALCAGLDMVKGDACIVMDSDLQHPPELIPEMVRLWREEGYNIVEGVKSFRGNESLRYKICAKSFYVLLRKVSGIDLRDASDFRLLDSKALAAWRRMNESNVFFRAMSTWVGFRRIKLPFKVADRKGGTTKWSFLKLLKLAINAITSFSSMPLQIVTFLGTLFLIGAIILAVQTLYMKFSGIAVSGFTTVILILLVMGSGLMISLGIIGTYIAKIFDEVKKRPRYIITDSFDNTRKGNPYCSVKEELKC